MFRQGSQELVTNGYGFWAGGEGERLEGHSVMSYQTFRFSRALASASWMLGDGFTRFTYRVASRNLKTALA
jgi:hypothetical protein